MVFFGYRICIYADKIGRITKISRTFIGLILLSVVTSLPELAVAISAAKIGALDLALGDLFGSNLFNLTIVAIILFVFVRQPKLLTFDSTHLISAGITILLIALAAVGIIFYNLFNPYVSYSNIFLDVETVLILVIYVFGVYLIFHSEKGKAHRLSEPGPHSKLQAVTTKNLERGGPHSKLQAVTTKNLERGGPAERKNTLTVWLKFLACAAILVGFAIYLSRLGDQIARIPVGGTALGGTFVGGLFIAVTTSLPEAAVALSALKLGFLDMALANIFGSNMFNMAIISIADLSLGRKVLLSSVAPLHLMTVFFVIISTVLVTSGLVYRSRRKTPALAWDSVSILFVYVTANLITFYLR